MDDLCLKIRCAVCALLCYALCALLCCAMFTKICRLLLLFTVKYLLKLSFVCTILRF